MMKIERLAWDSEFFNRNIGAIHIDHQWESLNLESAEKEGFESIVIFSKVRQPLLDQSGVFSETRLTFSKDVSSESQDDTKYHIPIEVNKPLLEIFLHSGDFSRFRLDPVFQPRFEALYLRWLENALSGKFDDYIFCTGPTDNPSGVITLRKKKGSLGIGIIAVATEYRGRGVGSSLLTIAEDTAQRLNYSVITVVTQGQNKGARTFYEKNGFVESERQWVYHIHLKE